MKAYIDSSVILRIIFGEKNSLHVDGEIEYLIACEILKIECLRTIDRMRHELRLSDDDVAMRSELLHKAMRTIRFVKLADIIIQRAGQPFPIVIKTLDAIHLSTALIWQRREKNNLIFLTHDDQLGKTARAMGFLVKGC